MSEKIVGNDFAARAQLIDGAAEIDGVPKDDCGDGEIEAKRRGSAGSRRSGRGFRRDDEPTWPSSPAPEARFEPTEATIDSVEIDTTRMHELIGPTSVPWREGMMRMARRCTPTRCRDPHPLRGGRSGHAPRLGLGRNVRRSQ